MTKAMMKMTLILASMTKHMQMLKSIRRGALTVILSSCWKALCKLETSVVILVTSPDVLNLSMSEKENVCMLVYMASLRLAAKPVEA